ncbi:MAG: phytoene/squalene synthase family protein [Candidatus Kapaibacteriales bacterium]
MFYKDEKLFNYFEYSRMVIKKHAKSFYYSSRFFPNEVKWSSYAVYASCRYIDNIVDNPRERSESEIRKELDHIRNELKLAYKYGESEHPALGGFAIVASRYSIPIDYPLDLINGAEMDLTINEYETFDDLDLFCYRVASVVGLMMTHVMGYKGGKDTLDKAEKLGKAMQLTNILRDIAEDSDMGRIYIPKEDLDSFGLDKTSITSSKFTRNFREMMYFQVERAKGLYLEANPGIDMLSEDCRFAIYSASKIYGSILDEIVKRDYNPFKGRAYITTSQKTSILFRELFTTKVRKFKAA